MAQTDIDKINVVIVEDDAALALSLKAIFEIMNEVPVRVSIASTGVEALMLARDSHAVLLDHHLADRDEGAALLKLIRSKTDAPVIVFTGNDDPSIKDEVKKHNAELYIKPDAYGALQALGKAMASYVERTYGKKRRGKADVESASGG